MYHSCFHLTLIGIGWFAFVIFCFLLIISQFPSVSNNEMLCCLMCWCFRTFSFFVCLFVCCLYHYITRAVHFLVIGCSYTYALFVCLFACYLLLITLTSLWRWNILWFRFTLLQFFTHFLSTCFVCCIFFCNFFYSYYVLCFALFTNKKMFVLLELLSFSVLLCFVMCNCGLLLIVTFFRMGNFICFYPLSQMLSFARGWFEFCYAFVAFFLSFARCTYPLHCSCS